MKPTDENLNSPISGQFKSSPFYVAVGSVAVGAVGAIVATWICYKLLPQDVASGLVVQLQAAFLGTGALGSIGGAFGMVKRGLDITQGKITAQGGAKGPETVNEGSLDLGDALKGAVTGVATNYAVGEISHALDARFYDDTPAGQPLPSE